MFFILKINPRVFTQKYLKTVSNFLRIFNDFLLKTVSIIIKIKTILKLSFPECRITQIKIFGENFNCFLIFHTGKNLFWNCVQIIFLSATQTARRKKCSVFKLLFYILTFIFIPKIIKIGYGELSKEYKLIPHNNYNW